MEFVILVEFWHWWVLSLCFVVFAGMYRSPIYIALTLASGLMGAYITQQPFMPILLQLGVFTTLTLIFVVLLNYWNHKSKSSTPAEQQEPDANHMIGVEFELSSAIQNGFGEIKLDGQHWSIKGPRIKAGTQVRVLKLDGQMLMVMPVDIIKQHREEQEEAEKNSRI